MLAWLKQLDELLRGDRTRADQLAAGRFSISLSVFVPCALALGAMYGLFMGLYALTGQQDGRYLHALLVMGKVPALFLLTLAVTFPSLYVFNALVGCRLNFLATLPLLIAAIVINLAVAASLGPIVGFFTLSTTSYHFMVLLNVLAMSVAGIIGLSFMLKVLRALARASHPKLPPLPPPPPDDASGPEVDAVIHQRAQVHDSLLARHRQDAAANRIFHIWVIIYAIVGAQMSWILRPFVGSPTSPLSVFRVRDGNFFSAVWDALRHLLGL